MATNIMRSADFNSIVSPILNEAFDGVYDQRKDEWKAIFKEITGIPRQYHEEPVLFGMGSAPEMPDGTPVTYQAGGVLFNKRYLYKVYGLAYALTQVLVEDGDHIRIGKTYAEHLAQSLIETKELKCANILNFAFNAAAQFQTGDGVALASASHPVIGGTYSNLATSAALSQTSLEQMIIQIRNATDANGKKIRLMPKTLVVAPGNEMQAEVLLNSVLRTGTNNNDINPVKSMGLLKEVAVISRLTSPNAWFITTDAPKGLQILMRRKLTKSMEGDFETDSMRYKATERYETGVTNPLALFSNQGI